MQFNKDRTDNIGYLGPSFQLKVLLELLTDTKFSENVLQYLHSKYFDDDSHKRLLIEIKNYYEKYEKSPSLKNNSIYEVIYEKISDEIEREVLTKILDKLKVVYKNRKIGIIPDDGEVTQQKVWLFIKQQEYKGLGQYIIKKTVEGNLDDIEVIESKIQVIHKIGPDDDTGVDVFSEIDDTLEPDFRNTIPTGLGQEIDDLMGGGLGNGEMGFILAGLGTGKAQPLTAKVLTPNGWKLMADIQLGDEVISSNGKPTKVLGVFPQEGDRDVYKVEFNDGSVTECDIDHLWSIRTDINQEYEVKEFNQIIDLVNNDNKVYIPVVKPIEFNKKKISNKFHYKNKPYDLGSSLYAYSYDMINTYIEYIINNSVEFKIEFIKGYFQSKINKIPIKNNLLSIKEADIYYLRKLYEIIKSIGGIGEFNTCEEFKWPKLDFTLPKEIFNKIFENEVYNLKPINKFIKNVEYKGKEKTQCIYVEDESHEYVTDDYIVTHNTTALTKIANHGHSLGKNVLQIFFEDNKKQIKRKHYAIWSGVAQSEIDTNVKIVKENVLNVKKNHQNKLILVKFPQDDNITVPFLKRWILNYQKVFNIKFDMIVLDYIDCVESHEKNNNSDTLSNELKVVKAFEAMLAELNIPGWSAIQGNRNSLGAEVVTTNQMGGNIKKAQKTHFLMSIARSDEQKEKGVANIKILKSRFGRDGILFEDCLFNNDTLQINIRRDFNPMQHFANNAQNNPVLSRPVITDEDDAEMKKTVLGLS
jgi:hypothetical protein